MKNEILIQNAIERGDLEFARDLLRQAMQEEPHLAQVWYLAAQAAANDAQREHFLKQAVERDPLHHKAANELNALQNPALSISEPAVPTTPRPASQASANTQTSHDYADFTQRLGAFVIDAFILAFGVMAGLFIFNILFGDSDVDTGRVISLTTLWTVILQAAYNGYFLSTTGQTPGKQAMGIRVEKRTGGHLSPRDAVIRAVIGYSLSSSVLGAGFFWMLTDAQAQAWHDMVADSVVVRTGEPAFFS
ncbi:MAG: RDD family protein [Chloroflexota bacterium]